MYKLPLPSLLPSSQISHKKTNPEHFPQLLAEVNGSFSCQKTFCNVQGLDLSSFREQDNASRQRQMLPLLV